MNTIDKVNKDLEKLGIEQIKNCKQLGSLSFAEKMMLKNHGDICHEILCEIYKTLLYGQWGKNLKTTAQSCLKSLIYREYNNLYEMGHHFELEETQVNDIYNKISHCYYKDESELIDYINDLLLEYEN